MRGNLIVNMKSSMTQERESDGEYLFQDETFRHFGDHRRCVCNDHRITGSDFRNRIIKKQI